MRKNPLDNCALCDITGLAASSAAIAVRTLLNDPGLAVKGFGIAMALSIFVFTVLLTRCEVRENSEGGL